MDESALMRGVIGTVLGRRGRRSRRALRYLTGGRGGRWLNSATLLAAAGVAWGVIETLHQREAGAAPVETSPTAGPVSPVPPLPGVQAVSENALRIVRLAIAAGLADGGLDDTERSGIMAHATAAGAATVVERELAHPRPLQEIVAGVTADVERETLYVLAFAIARGDQQPSGAERIFLARLAHVMGLDPERVRALEETAARRIEDTGVEPA